MRCHIIHITHLKYTTQWALVYSDLITMTTVNFRIFFLSQKETSNPHWSQHLPLSLASFSSVAQSCLILCDAMDCSTPGLPCPSPTPGVHPNPHPLSQFFALCGQSIGVSAWTSALPMNIQDWFPWGWTSWISLQSKGLSRVFSNTTVQKHQIFSAQLSL